MMSVELILLTAVLFVFSISLYFYRKRNDEQNLIIIEMQENLNCKENLLDQLAVSIKNLEQSIWNLEEERDMLLETLERAGVKPEDLDPVVIEKDYATMAEALACKREDELDAKRDEAFLAHMEDDCDQCNQDGEEVCSVKNDILSTN